MKSIFLIGFMGSGKSTIGASLAQELQINWTDTDEKMVKDLNKKISDIFNVEGEATFRIYETNTLKNIPIENHVISTGGGIIGKQENVRWMREYGIVIYLHTSFEEIYNRLKNDTSRPLWNKAIDEKQSLYEFRLPLYKNAGHFQINTDGKTISDIVTEILLVIKS